MPVRDVGAPGAVEGERERDVGLVGGAADLCACACCHVVAPHWARRRAERACAREPLLVGDRRHVRRQGRGRGAVEFYHSHPLLESSRRRAPGRSAPSRRWAARGCCRRRSRRRPWPRTAPRRRRRRCGSRHQRRARPRDAARGARARRRCTERRPPRRSGQATMATLSCDDAELAGERLDGAHDAARPACRRCRRGTPSRPAPCSACASRSAASQRGSRRLVGDDEDLAGAGQAVDADLAHHLTLGLGDVGVARPHDDVAARDRGRAEGHGRDRLGAADGIQVVDAEEPAGGGHAGGHAAVAAAAASRRRCGSTPATCAGMAVMSTDDG